MRRTIRLFLGGLALFLGTLAAHASDGKGPLSVLALGPADGRAVVQYHGRMHVVRIGDELPGTKAKVTEVLPDKLVASEIVGRKDRRRVTLWIFKAAKPGEASRIQKFDRKGPKRRQSGPPKAKTTEIPLKNLEHKK